MPHFRSFLLSLVRCSAATERDIIAVSSSSSSSFSPSDWHSDSRSDIVCCLSRPASPINEQFVLTDQSIDDLPDDIIHLIVEVLFGEGDLASIKTFSLMSRHLRAISLPFLFRYHCWRPGYLRDLLPSQYWNYIRVFHLMLEGRRRFTLDMFEAFAAALSNMVNITNFKLTGGPDFGWVRLLNSLASLPRLSSLEFVFSFQYLYPMRTPKTFVRPPTRLALHFHCHDTWRTPIPDIFSLCAEKLEYLELCEGFVQLDLLQALEWPNLREFIICGHSFYGRTSITPVLKVMPQLRRLDLSFRCKPESSMLVLWSPLPPEGTPSTILQQLETLAVANPSSFDDSFHLLPPTLKSLSILACSPSLIPLDREELYQMLRSIRATNLTTLRIVIEGILDDYLFTFINSTFPCLEVLGIHRFAQDQRIEKAGEVAAKLRNFKHLKLLQLNIGIQSDPSFDPQCAAPRRWVEKIASNVPWIRQIAFSTPLTFFNQHWVTFTLEPSNGGAAAQHKRCVRHSVVPRYMKLQP